MNVHRLRPVFPFFVLALFFCVIVLVQHVGFNGPTYYDTHHLEEKEHLLAGGLVSDLDLFPQRPIPVATFYFNYVLGGLSPVYYRVFNAVALAVTALLLMSVAILLLSTPAMAGRGNPFQKKVVGLCIGLAFAVHPVQPFLVLYIWQRAALLACLFYFGAFACYLMARTGRISRPWTGYVTCFLLFLCAVASKENAATLPGILILTEIAFFRPGLKNLLARSGILVAAAAVAAFMLSFLERPHGLGQASGIVATFSRYYQEAGLSLYQVWVTECRMLFAYIDVTVLPFPSKLLLVSPQLFSASALESLGTFACVLAACALTILGVLLLKRMPLTGFGILFFIINLIPESFLVPIYLFVGYRVALPMVGLLLIFADAALFLLERTVHGKVKTIARGSLAVGFLAAVILMGFSTRAIATVWNDPVVFWKRIVDQIPPLAKNLEKHGTLQSLNQLGAQLQVVGRHAEAIPFHEKALLVETRTEVTLALLGSAYLGLGDPVKAESYFNMALRMNPRSVMARAGLAGLLAEQNRLEEAVSHFKKLVDIAPHNASYQHILGFLLLKEKKFPEAVPHFMKAVQLNPRYADAYYQMGKALLEMGNTADAVTAFQKTLELKPDHVPAHCDLGVILATSGQVEQAVLHFKEALRLDPKNEMARENLKTALQQIEELSGTQK